MIKKTLSFNNPAHLSLRLNQLNIKLDDGTLHTRPIEDIATIIIESPRVTFTTALMARLAAQNVSVIFCDDSHMPSALVLPLTGHTEQTMRFNAQIQASLPLRKQLWQQTVTAKISNQAAAFRRITGNTPDNMNVWATKVRSGDPDNLEGRAAAFYWRNVFSEFPMFSTRGDTDIANSLLNYGYAILRSVIARNIVGSGLIPTLGIHHSNKYNPFCLADDIMEPYRPFVDMMVADILRQNPGLQDVDRNAKNILLTLPTIDVTIDGIRRPLMIAACFTTAALAQCYLGATRKISYPVISL